LGWAVTLTHLLSSSAFLTYLVTDGLPESSPPSFTLLAEGDQEGSLTSLHRGEEPKALRLVVTVPTCLDRSLAPEGKQVVRIMALAPRADASCWGPGEAAYRRAKEKWEARVNRLAKASAEEPEPEAEPKAEESPTRPRDESGRRALPIPHTAGRAAKPAAPMPTGVLLIWVSVVTVLTVLALDLLR